MSGSSGARGYLLQALVALLDSLDPGDRWEDVTIEPQDDAEKVDIRWRYSNRKKVVQVKSSKNQIGMADAKRWADELEKSTTADEYELRLIGPPSGEVAGTTRIGKVVLPTPEAENVRAWIERIAHKLDGYLRDQKAPQTIGPEIREFIAEALSNRLLTHSTLGKPLTRSDFDALLQTWTANILNERLSQTPIVLQQSRNAFFYARDHFLQRIRANLDSATEKGTGGVEVLSGLGGVGKTQIAIEYAYRHWTDYSAIFFIDADTEQTLTTGFARVAEQLQLVTSAEHSPRSAATAAKSWFESNNSWLLILDNADDPATLRSFLPSLNGGHCIISSRSNTFDVIGVARPHVVGVLTPDESRDFLLLRTGRTELSNDERNAAHAIGADLDGLPLALEQAGAYITSRQVSFVSYLNTLRKRHLELLERAKPITGDYAKTVATTWSLNFDAVREDSRAASDVLILSAFLYPNDIPFEFLVVSSAELSTAIDTALANVIKDQDFTRVDDLLYPLAKYSLITKDSLDLSYSLHRLVQAAAINELDSDIAADWRRRVIRAIGRAFPEVSFETWPFCSRLFNHAISVLSAARESDLNNEYASSALHRAAHYMEEQGDYRFAHSLFHQAIKSRENTPRQDQGDLGTSLNQFALTLHKLGRYAEAEAQYRRALPLRSAAKGDKDPAVAQTLNNLGLALVEQGRFDEAERSYRDAEHLLLQAGPNEEHTLAVIKSNIAGLLKRKGRLDESESLMREALEIQRRQFGDGHPEVTFTMKNVAHFVFEQGKLDEAMLMMKDIMEWEQKTMGINHPHYAKSLNLMGAIYAKRRQFSEAERVYRRAGDIIFKTNGRHPDLGLIYNNLASLYMEQGQLEKAISYFREAENVYCLTEGTDHVDVQTALVNRANCHGMLGDPWSALECYEAALPIAMRVYGRCSNDVAVIIASSALAENRRGNNEEALRLYADAFAIYQEMGFPKIRDCKVFLNNYAVWLGDMGDTERSGEIREILKSLGD